MPQIAEPITSLEQELELRIEWLEKGLKEIANKTLGLDDMIQSILDGEPTTADEHNKGVAVLTSGMDALAKDKKYVRISDVNKEIAVDWKNREREEKIKKKTNMIQSIGYRGED